MAVGAVVNVGGVLPEEGATLFRMTRVAGLVNRVLHEQRRTGRAVRIVAVGTRHFAFRDRVPREATNLCPLGFVAGKADFGLRQLVEHPMDGDVCLMAIAACDAAGFMLAARPVRPGKNAGLVAGKTVLAWR